MQIAHPSIVHTQQTSVQFSATVSYGEVLRTSCQPEYAAALRVYTLLDGSEHTGRAERLKYCRSNAWFSRNLESGEVRVASSSCSLRWCPICRNAKRNYMTHEIAEWLCKADHPKLLTLTLRHTSEELTDQIDQLYSAFRELRRRKDFRDPVSGGIWFFQVKRSKTDGKWHPHLHCLITGKYIPRKRISHMWCQVTSGSEVIDIRPIHDPRAVANDVARYATSPGSLVNVPLDDGLEMVEALHGRRICGTWGTARGIRMRPAKEESKGKWESLGSWTTVMMEYNTNPDARAIILSWKTGVTLSKGITCNHIDKAIEKMSRWDWAEYDFETPYAHERGPP